MTVGDIANGVIDIKFGALEFIARLPLEMIEIILNIPSATLQGLSVNNNSMFMDFMGEVGGFLNVYSRYNNAMGLPMGALPLGDFANMSRDLMTMSMGMDSDDMMMYRMMNGGMNPMMSGGMNPMMSGGMNSEALMMYRMMNGGMNDPMMNMGPR